MSISGIGGAMGGVNYYNNRVNRNTNQVASSFSTGTCINLKMTDEDSGSRALTSVGYPDGSSASVFRAEGYTDGKASFAKASAQYESGGFGEWDFSEKMDWVSMVEDVMESVYQYGDMKGYMDWKRFLDLLN